MTPKEARRRADEDLRAVLATPAGRRLFLRLVTQAGTYSGSYAESPTATAFNEGRRSIGISLLREAQLVAPELYARALKEGLDAEALLGEAEEAAGD